MIGSFLTRGLLLAFAYAYPAYECYKTVEKNRPEIEQLRFWCQYWILVAVLTVGERIGDAFISWVPMYSEAKLAFFIYLWYPKTKGTTYVYDSFFRPYVSKHESDIDRNLLELRTRAGDIAVLYWQRAASYGQTRVFDILQYVASQSTPNPRPAPARQPGTRPPPTHRPSIPKFPAEPEEPPSPSSSTSSSQDQNEVVEAEASRAPSASAPAAPKAAPSASAPTAPKVAPSASALAAPRRAPSNESSSQPVPRKQGVDPMETEAPATDDATHGPNADPLKVTLMEETLHRTHGRLRKARAASTKKETESAAPS
ncbi:hypothetical protein MLD38_022208 [Melastoma candidum]|uniref:Uncharacterized protein n=1 Tax=Melastoma candidum TaxID=119954 RepID=A0ACB9QJ19_9MYRT|nr:hypothetical protein MLD38_022208 [Melastoma candidum]